MVAGCACKFLVPLAQLACARVWTTMVHGGLGVQWWFFDTRAIVLSALPMTVGTVPRAGLRLVSSAVLGLHLEPG